MKTICTICGKPLSEKEIALKVTAHFSCVFNEAFGAK